MSLTDLMSMAKPNSELRHKILSRITEATPVDCFKCGKCTSGCTALKLLELKPHEIVNLVKLGFVEELASSDIIWTCVTCLKCTERCPQKATPYHVVLALRNLAVEKEAKVPEEFMKVLSHILEDGLIQGIQKIAVTETEIYDRENLKLPKIPRVNQKFSEILFKALEEGQK